MFWFLGVLSSAKGRTGLEIERTEISSSSIFCPLGVCGCFCVCCLVFGVRRWRKWFSFRFLKSSTLPGKAAGPGFSFRRVGVLSGGPRFLLFRVGRILGI